MGFNLLKVLLEAVFFIDCPPDALSGRPFVARVPFRVEEQVDKDAVLILVVINIAERVLVVVVQFPQRQIRRHLFSKSCVEVTQAARIFVAACRTGGGRKFWVIDRAISSIRCIILSYVA